MAEAFKELLRVIKFFVFLFLSGIIKVLYIFNVFILYLLYLIERILLHFYFYFSKVYRIDKNPFDSNFAPLYTFF
jgi:hypothetical protein